MVPEGAVSRQAGSGPTGDQRLEQLARPKTAHWDKCKYVCPPITVCQMTCSTWFCMWTCFLTSMRQPDNPGGALTLRQISLRMRKSSMRELCCADEERGWSSTACHILLFPQHVSSCNFTSSKHALWCRHTLMQAHPVCIIATAKTISAVPHPR